jgi:transcription elongation factor GreA-like protein
MSGSRVAHPTFGDGTVVEVHDREVLVKFDHVKAPKWLAIDHAKLRPL